MRSNVRWGVLGNATYSLAQWAQFAVLARLAGPAVLGAYAYALAVAAPVMAIAGLQLGTLQVADPRGPSAFREYRRVRLSTTGLAVLLIVGVAAVSGPWREMLAVFVPVCAMRAADALTDIYCACWQRAERLALPNVAKVLNGLLSLLLTTIAVSLGGGAPGAASGSALGSVAALVFMHVSTARSFHHPRDLPHRGPPPARSAFHDLAVKGLPLGLIVLLGTIQQNAPLYFIRHGAGDEAALGIFAAASQLTAAGMLVVTALGDAVSPRFAGLHRLGDLPGVGRLARRAGLACAALGVAGLFLAAVGGRAVLSTVYRPEFASGDAVLVVLSAAATLAFAAAPLGYALTIVRVLAPQTWGLLLGNVALIATCAVLVPRLGALGAAWGAVAGAAVQLLANVFALRWVVTAPSRVAGERST